MSTLRERAYEEYTNGSIAAHRPATRQETERFVKDYLYHLRGWLPSGAGDWLDLGCGQGALLSLATQLGYKALGVDVSAPMLSSATQLNLTVVNSDLTSYIRTCAGESQDVISLFDVLEHMSKDEAWNVLKEVRRCLRRQGVCLIKVPNLASPFGPEVSSDDLTHEIALSPTSLRQLAKLAGFSEVDIREVGPIPNAPIRCVRWLLWQLIRFTIRLVAAGETGSFGSPIRTRVMLARLS